MDDYSNYTVKITRRARQQLQEIVQQIDSVALSPNAGLRLVDKLEKEIMSLSVFPARAPLTEEEPWHSQGVRKLLVKKYFIYFWINEDARKVQVTAIIHSRRDQLQHLWNMEFD